MINIQFRVSIFGTFSSIEASPEHIMRLMKLFSEDNFMPTIVDDTTLSMTGNVVLDNNSQIVGNQIVKRPVFITADNEWTIRIGLHRIDIEKNNINIDNSVEKTELSASEKLGTFKEFITKANNYLSLLIGEFPLVSNRMAINTTTFLNVKDKDSIYKLFANVDVCGENKIPFEWNFRVVNEEELDIVGIKEKTNVGIVLQRSQGMIISPGKQINMDELNDHVVLAFDINTKANAIVNRFNLEHIEGFFLQTADIRDKIATKIQERIGNE